MYVSVLYCTIRIYIYCTLYTVITSYPYLYRYGVYDTFSSTTRSVSVIYPFGNAKTKYGQPIYICRYSRIPQDFYLPGGGLFAMEFVSLGMFIIGKVFVIILRITNYVC